MKTCSIGLFGKNAELLIDHAWGFEPCTVPEIKAYNRKPTASAPGRFCIVRMRQTKQSSF